MSLLYQKIILIFDDREFTNGDVRSLVGQRRFGDVYVKRLTLADHIRAALPEWARSRLIHLRSTNDVENLRTRLEASQEDVALCIIAASAGFMAPESLTQLVERLPFAEEDFTDSLYRPLLVFMRNAHRLVEQWPAFEAYPLHCWDKAWQDSQRLLSVKPIDLTKIRDFLTFTTGSTAARYFNEVQIDDYYYTKRSTDKRKILAEYSFYGLVPEKMRPWLIQPFGYKDEEERASYKMMRYYLADAALQWVHGAFEVDTFSPFVERLLFFLDERPRRACSKEESAAQARAIFVVKPEERVKQFLAVSEGQRINQLVVAATPALDVSRQLERYLELYQRYESGFVFDHTVVGHGDPCFSNVLYDQQRQLLKLIDPKGAVTENELWTHPLYDLCKVSHSALGDYDFINTGLYSVGFSNNNDLLLQVNYGNHGSLKSVFLQRVQAINHDAQIMRLGEASLFLSMLPLHIDYPNKIIAFLLKAQQILDEVEYEYCI